MVVVYGPPSMSYSKAVVCAGGENRNHCVPGNRKENQVDMKGATCSVSISPGGDRYSIPAARQFISRSPEPLFAVLHSIVSLPYPVL